MSWQAVEHVLATSAAQVNERLVAIVLAAAADAEGRDAFPSVGTIARRARCGESTVRRALESLLARGELVEDGVGPRGTRRFHIDMTASEAPARKPANRPHMKQDTPAEPAPPAESAAPPQSLAPGAAELEPHPPQTLADAGANPAPEPSIEPPPEPSDEPHSLASVRAGNEDAQRDERERPSDVFDLDGYEPDSTYRIEANRFRWDVHAWRDRCLPDLRRDDVVTAITDLRRNGAGEVTAAEVRDAIEHGTPAGAASTPRDRKAGALAQLLTKRGIEPTPENMRAYGETHPAWRLDERPLRAVGGMREGRAKKSDWTEADLFAVAAEIDRESQGAA